MPPRQAVRTYLEMTDPGPLGPSDGPLPEGVRIERMQGCPASFYRYLYREVGQDWHWTDRQAWTDEQIAAHLADPAVALHLLSVRGAPAGYFELVRHRDRSREIAYLGLLPEFIGRSLGRLLLAAATRTAWEDGTTRVWLHTCTLDHPAALPNYLARGFRAVREETFTVPG